jgi:hypothetical protein
LKKKNNCLGFLHQTWFCTRSKSAIAPTSNSKSGGCVLIAVKRIFDVSELSTTDLSLVEHGIEILLSRPITTKVIRETLSMECVQIKCDDFSL